MVSMDFPILEMEQIQANEPVSYQLLKMLFLMIWIYFNILLQLPQVSSKLEAGLGTTTFSSRKTKCCKTLDGSDLQIDIFPHLSRSSRLESQCVWMKILESWFSLRRKKPACLTLSGRPPPRKCFMAPGWGVRAVCSLCNFSHLWSKRFAQQ